jgi:HEPN domain-containing protein
LFTACRGQRPSEDFIGPGLRRSDLQANAQTKIDDAIILFRNGRFSNAYYLAGCAVEIGLKACIAAQISAETLPNKAFMKNILSHQFRGLVGLAGLAGALKDEEDRDQNFATNWALASQWEPDVRYEAVDPRSAQILIEAIANPNSGVLQWIKTHW